MGSDQLTYRQPGDRVALNEPNGIERMVANFAIAKSGAVVYPINVTPTPLEVALVAQDLGADVPRGMRFVERAPMASYWPRRDEPAK